MANGAKPKPAFFIAVLVVVAGLVGLAFFQCKKKDKTNAKDGSAFVDPRKGSDGSATAESSDPNPPPTTVKEYQFEPAQKLSPVEGTSSYKALGKPRIVRFAVNTWAGWAPIIWANQGHKAGKVWKDAKGQDFQVELVLADDPVQMGNTVANGGVHIGWATVDMLPLIIERLKKDPRTMPRVYQQVDWSNGGDGIVSRKDITSVNQLKGKTVTLAQNSPSHYFLLNMLLNAGVMPGEVKMRFAKDPFQAAAAYNANKDISAVVTWAPDIYTLTEKKESGNNLLIATNTANKLIADVWFARADFGRDHPEIIEGLVRGIFDATEELQQDANKAKVGPMMDAFYKLEAGTGVKMLPDAHWTNYAENKDFFMVSSNPTNFERTYNNSVRLYSAIGVVNADTAFDKIMDFSVIKKLANEPKYASSKNTYEYQFTPKTAKDLDIEKKDPVLTKVVTIQFVPNSYEVFKKVENPAGGPPIYYDGNVEYTIEEIAKLAGQFGSATIEISGHTDASKKGEADPGLVKELSENRANAVKEAILRKYPKIPQNQLIARGYGWEKPAEGAGPTEYAKHRRVEVKVIPLEAPQ